LGSKGESNINTLIREGGKGERSGKKLLEDKRREQKERKGAKKKKKKKQGETAKNASEHWYSIFINLSGDMGN
jgi:hypothetical protein